MFKIIFVLISFLLFLGLVFQTGVEAKTDPGSGKAKKNAAVQNEVLINFKPGITIAEVRNFYAEHGLNEKGKLGHRRDQSPRLRLAKVKNPRKMADPISFVKTLERDPRVDYAELNYILSISGPPDDPKLGELWGLDNTGQTSGTIDADIDALEAWDVTTGSAAVVVGIIDTGVAYDHADLVSNLWTNPGESGLDANGNDKATNGIDDDNNGYVDDVHGINAITDNGDPWDDHGHGTHVAGTIGARGNNGVGVAGVNWTVQIVSCKFLDSTGAGNVADAVKCFKYFNYLKQVQGQNILVTNNSWGGGGFSQSTMDSMAALDQPGMAPILHAVAAGNSSNDNDTSISYPSGYDLDNIIAMAATDHNDLYAGFSSYGATTVDLGAPGDNILSTVPTGVCTMCDPSGYGSADGTSMATPHVAGAAALVWDKYPDLSASEMNQRLLAGTDYIGDGAGNSDKPTQTNGRLNVLNALDNDTTAPDDVIDLAAVESGLASTTLSWTATGDDGVTGSAAVYDVRYSTSSPLDWDTATQVRGESPPLPAGSVETFTVSGLDTDTTYYFGLQVKDNVGNKSGISNVVTETTAVGTVVFQDDMESGAGGWTPDGLWNLDDYRSDSPTHAWYYGQTATRSYDTGGATTGYLTSGAIDLAGATDAALTFSEWSEVESAIQFDRTRVEVPSDGIVWATIFESHNTKEWLEGSVSLKSYIGGDVYVRFYFTTRDTNYNNYEGWYVDNVTVLAALSEAPPPDTTPPAAPTGLIATAGDGQVSLDWADNTEADLASYNVHQATSSGGPYTQVASQVVVSEYTDTGQTNGTTYYYVVTAVDGTGNESNDSAEGSAMPEVAPPPDTTPPAAPTGLVATAGDGQVTLDWADNTEADLASYNVQRATSSGAPYTQVASQLAVSEYTDTGLTNGTTYYYVVTAVDDAGNESANSTEGSATPEAAPPPADTTPPAAPAALSATAGDGQVSLDWDDNTETDLAGYNVHRSTVSSVGSFSQIASQVVSSEYTDTGVTNGTTYYYTVTAVDEAGNESADSTEGSATPADTTPPAAPTSLSATAGDGQVSLDWADNAEGDLAEYIVHRSTTSGGAYTEAAISVVASEYTDSGLTNGTTYYYVVTAVDSAANESADSSQASAAPADTTAPAAPTGLITTAGDGQVSLDWGDNAEGDLAEYIVHRSTTRGGPYTEAAITVVASEYTDGGLANGTTYYYVVTAVDSAGNESADSSQASAMPEAAPVEDSSNRMYVWDIIFKSSTKGKNGKNHSERVKVVVRWDSDGDGVAEASDELVVNATVSLSLTGPGMDKEFSGLTGEGGKNLGIFRTDLVKNLDDGTYTAEVTGLTHATYLWNQTLDPTGNATDLDGDNLPDQQHTISH